MSSMSSRRITNFSDLIQRVTASCLLHPLANQSHPVTSPNSETGKNYATSLAAILDSSQEEEQVISDTETANEEERKENVGSEMETIMWQVFDAVSDMKRAYAEMQAAHSPWDPDRIRAADAVVVREIRRIGGLREKFRRRSVNSNFKAPPSAGSGNTRVLVAPYEAAVEELKRELKSKQVEIDNLKAKQYAGRKGRSEHSRRKLAVYSSMKTHVPGSPSPELFEATMSSVIKASKSFTTVVTSLMRSANCDMAAAARSIQAANISTATADLNGILAVGPHHAKYAMESYVSHKIFQGFDHETFYMDGSLSSLLNPNQFRSNCFAQYRDMHAMDPNELLGILPTCPFGKFCLKKYLEILHSKMEESLFEGDLEQRRQVIAGVHPRTHFYGQFLAFAKSVWLLHLLAFSLETPPSRFEAARGAEFQPHFMEDVASNTIDQQLVGFPLTPGFKLGNGSVIKARVCLVPRIS